MIYQFNATSGILTDSPFIDSAYCRSHGWRVNISPDDNYMYINGMLISTNNSMVCKFWIDRSSPSKCFLSETYNPAPFMQLLYDSTVFTTFISNEPEHYPLLQILDFNSEQMQTSKIINWGQSNWITNYGPILYNSSDTSIYMMPIFESLGYATFITLDSQALDLKNSAYSINDVENVYSMYSISANIYILLKANGSKIYRYDTEALIFEVFLYTSSEYTFYHMSPMDYAYDSDRVVIVGSKDSDTRILVTKTLK